MGAKAASGGHGCPQFDIEERTRSTTMKFRMHPNTRIQDKSLSNVSN